MNLTALVLNWLKETAHLADATAEKLLKFSATKATSIRALDVELAVQSHFLAKIESERSELQERNLYGSVVNSHEVELQDNKAERFALYDELRSRGYGKSLVVMDESERLHEYRISQANWTVKCGDSYVVNRLAPVAGMLVSAKVGDVLELPKIGEVEVISEKLLSGWNHIESDIHQLINTDELTENKPQTVSGGKRQVSHWIQNAEGMVEGQSLNGDVTTVQSDDIRVSGGDAVQAISDETELYIDPLREQSLAADFYTRTTREQEELIRQPQSGVVAVEGVAGSGKTSVGLGRLKALHDAQYSPQDSEEFTDFFNDKSRMRAFVLSPQLKSYLKRTLDELHLTNLPISDYEEFRKQLISHHAKLLAFKIPGAMTQNAKFSLARLECPDICHTRSWVDLLDKALLAGMRLEILDKLDWFLSRDLKVLPPNKAGGQVLHYEELISNWILEAKAQIQSLFERKRQSNTLSCMELGRELETIFRGRQQQLQQATTLYFNPVQKQWSLTRVIDDINPLSIKPWSSEGIGSENSEKLKRVRERLIARMRDSLLMESASFKGVPTYIQAGIKLSDQEGVQDTNLSLLLTRLADSKLAQADIDAMLVLSEALCFTSIRSRSAVDSSKDPVDLYRAFSRCTAVFIDEFQDFTEVQVSLMGLMADPKKNCITVVGDFCQQLSQRRIRDLNKCFIGLSSIKPFKLLENKRQTQNLASFSLFVRSKLEAGFNDIPPYIDTKGELERLSISESEWIDFFNEELSNIHPSKSVAVIFPSRELAEVAYREIGGEYQSLRDIQLSLDGRDLTKAFTAHFTTALPTKGLEFDVVFVPYFNRFDFADPISANSAYVAVSRAKERLVMMNISPDREI